jgi:hypothetical protein
MFSMRNIIKGIASVFVAGGLVVTPAVIGLQGGNANAAPSCTSGYTCVFKNKNYSVGNVKFTEYIGSFRYWKFSDGSSANDNISSVYNNGRTNSYLFQHDNGLGRSLLIKAKVEYKNLVDNSFNDYASSAYYQVYVK